MHPFEQLLGRSREARITGEDRQPEAALVVGREPVHRIDDRRPRHGFQIVEQLADADGLRLHHQAVVGQGRQFEQGLEPVDLGDRTESGFEHLGGVSLFADQH